MNSNTTLHQHAYFCVLGTLCCVLFMCVRAKDAPPACVELRTLKVHSLQCGRAKAAYVMCKMATEKVFYTENVNH